MEEGKWKVLPTFHLSISLGREVRRQEVCSQLAGSWKEDGSKIAGRDKTWRCTQMHVERSSNGRWLPGQSGNAAGKVVGTRNRFSEKFVSDVAAIWDQHGASVLEKMVAEEPARFADMCSRLIPRDVSLTVSQRLPGGLEAEDWAIAVSLFGAIKQALPDASTRSPSEVLNFVLEAIRSFDAKLIEPCSNVATALPNVDPRGMMEINSNINKGIAELANRLQTGSLTRNSVASKSALISSA